MKRIAVIFVLLALIVKLGCYGMNRKQQMTTSGATISAVGIGLIGTFSGGSPAVGAFVGADIGVLAG